MSKVHIGKKIREVLRRSAFKTVEDFAKAIGVTRGGANKIFTKESIALDQLEKISRVLNHDFMKYYTVDVAAESKEPYGYALKKEVEDLDRKISQLTKAVEKIQQNVAKLVDAAPVSKGKKKSPRN